MKNLIALLIVLLFSFKIQAGEELTIKTSIANYGEASYQDFDHFPYVNPDAKKGGKITLGTYGTFDNLNSYILKGQSPAGLGMITDSLMTGSADELMSAYPLIAESIELPEDLSFATFNINPNAKYDDGTSITAHDFKFAFEMIQQYGAPFLQSFFEDVESVEVVSDYKIKYNFTTKDTMKSVMIVSSSSPLSKKFWSDKDFSKISLDIPPSSGAYKIKSIDAGRNIVYERRDDYWAKDLNVNVGQNNFNEIQYDYYSDEEVMFEAFKAGKIDLRMENKASRWMSGYNVPAIKNGELIKTEMPQNQPMGLQGIFFNTRQGKLSDVRVRQALEKLFNFEYIQKNLLNGMYTRSKNYFNNSDWGYQYEGEEDFAPTVNSEAGITRENKREALALFEESGYILKDQKLINKETGEQLSIEFLLIAPSMERVTMPYIMDLRKLGIDANIRKVDTSQYVVRVNDFDFDAIVVHFSFFVPPGVELLSYYGSESADIKGAANYTGIKNEKVDAIIKEILAEKDLEKLKDKTRLLDKELLQGHYGIPQWYNNKHLVSYWDKFDMPETMPKYGIGFPNTWEIKSSTQRPELVEGATEKSNHLKFKIIGLIILVGVFLLMRKDLKKKKSN